MSTTVPDPLAVISSSPFAPRELGEGPDFQALPAKFVSAIAGNFTSSASNDPTGSIGISDVGIAATDGRNTIVVGEVAKHYRNTDHHRVELEIEEAVIYGRAFDATNLIPSVDDDPKNRPAQGEFPNVAAHLRRIDSMEPIVEISPDTLMKMAKAASSCGSNRIKIFRSVEDPNVFGFKTEYQNPAPAFGEASSVPVIGLISTTAPDSRRIKKSETIVHKLEFAASGPRINEVIAWAFVTGKVSSTTIQKHFKVGEATANVLLDDLVKRGVITESKGKKSVRVIVDRNPAEFMDPEPKAVEFALTGVMDREYPPTGIFAAPERAEQNEDLEKPTRKINQILSDFKISASVSDVHVGPTVTRFELALGANQAVGKVEKLGDDIQLRMEAENVRIEAPIPGKAAIGIEMPNATRRRVRISECLGQEFFGHRGNLVATLGVTVDGRPVYAELNEMPHLLIAGTTGSGKSVGLTSLICSLITRMGPDKLRLMLVDPKRVEMMPFAGLPHLVRPVITESSDAIESLEKMGEVMEERYQLLQDNAVRNIDGYNEKHPEAKLPYVVIVIDELADFMMTGDKERAEAAIVRLAQKSRATGIHMVIATQRPSVDVITGLIKANIPGRIAFMVASQIDSRTVLNGKGAESLCGKGDMLFAPAGKPPLRVQGCFVSDEEVEQLCAYWRGSNS